MTADSRKKQRRTTMPYMTKYERARIIGARAFQIAMNAPVMYERARIIGARAFQIAMNAPVMKSIG
ncbi:hypothetical protein T484DRAFT_1852248 [Baffinella frigidus]|nr:hypothetical protein T484DRAFT_1852248 [Cryptophyta sp. CCMP2293]